MSAIRLAYRYAKSLLDLAEEKQQVEAVYDDIVSLQKAMDNRDLWLLLKSPIVNTDKKLSIIKAIFGDKLSEMTNMFVNIVTKKHREFYLPEIANAFIQLYKKRKHIVKAKLTSAVAVNDDLINKIKAIVLADTKEDSVELETAVDATLLGGFILQYDDKLIDASIASKFAKLEADLQDNDYVRKF